MPRRKKTRSTGNFLRKVQRSAKVRSVRAKIRTKKAELKRLSSKYKAAIKSESKRLKKKR